MAGRPTKLTPETQKRICEALQAGNTRRAACLYAGISEQTLSNWLKQGEESGKGEHFGFLESVKKAEADAEVRAVAIIQKAMPENWTAAAWFLERKYPNDWGKTERLNLGNADGKPFRLTWDDTDTDGDPAAASPAAAGGS